MLTPDDLAAFKLREGGKDNLTDQVIEAAEMYLFLFARQPFKIREDGDCNVCLRYAVGDEYGNYRDIFVKGNGLSDAIRAAMRAEKGGDAK